MNSSQINFIRMPRTKQKTGLSHGGVYLHMQQGTLPSSIRIGEKAVAWIESEIDAVIKARIERRTDDEVRDLVKKLEADRAALTA